MIKSGKIVDLVKVVQWEIDVTSESEVGQNQLRQYVGKTRCGTAEVCGALYRASAI